MNDQRPLAVLRADGGSSVGMGHIMRSLALGEGLVERGWRVVLATHDAPAAVVSTAQAARVEVHAVTAAPGTQADAEELVSLHPHLAVVDGYHNDHGFFTRLERLGCPYAVIDDNVETRAANPDVVVNQNPHACAEMYEVFPRAQLLLGLEYALLRRSIGDRAPHTAGKDHERSPRVLVSMGGSDPLGLTIPLVRELGPLGCDVRVAVGPANIRAAEIRSAIEMAARTTEVDQADFLDELAGCTCAVVGAGSVLWETAHLGVPTVAVVVADNQAAPAAGAESLGFTCMIDARGADSAAADVGKALVALLDDPRRRAAMSRAGRNRVDGLGVERVAATLTARAEALRR